MVDDSARNREGEGPSLSGLSDGNASPGLLMMAAVETVLQVIGEDVEREGLVKTPLRVASAFHEALVGYQLSAKEIIESALFTEVGTSGRAGCGGGSGGLVTVSNIDSFALCESCLLPFRLRCHVAYIPCGHRVVGLSKFPRVAEGFAKRLQSPEKFASQLAEALNKAFLPRGVGVVVESWHVQWPGGRDGRGCEEQLGLWPAPVVAHAGRGQFEGLQSSLWDEMLAVLQFEGVDFGRADLRGGTDGVLSRQEGKSCPFRGVSSVGRFDFVAPKTGGNGRFKSMGSFSAAAAAMAVSVESLLRTMGPVEQPSAEELGWAASRFIEWIVAATQGSRIQEWYGADHDPKEGCLVSGKPTADGEIHCSGSMSNALSAGGCNPVKGVDRPDYSNGKVDGTGALSNGSSSGQSGLTEAPLGTGLVASGCRVMNGLQRTGASSFGNDPPREAGNGGALSRIGLRCEGEFSNGPLFCSERDLPFSSLCEHHLLPFFGVVYVGYVPTNGTRRIDRALVAGIVAMYSRRLQAQERLTRQIVEGVASLAGLQGAVAVARARHMCVMSRGVAKLGSTTATVATVGKFSTDGAIRAAFLRSLPRKGSERIAGL